MREDLGQSLRDVVPDAAVTTLPVDKQTQLMTDQIMFSDLLDGGKGKDQRDDGANRGYDEV